MTATEVFFRFAKENGYYNFLQKKVKKAICTASLDTNPIVCDKLIKMHGKKNFSIDMLLKKYNYTLFDVIYLIDSFGGRIKAQLFREIHKKWSNYVRGNLKGNYYKRFIKDEYNELDRFRYRNGYHAIDFTYK